jgi:signal transduction histidine kinase
VNRPRWMFFRAYFIIAILVLVTGLGLEMLLQSNQQDQRDATESRLLIGSFLLAESFLPLTGDTTKARLQVDLSNALMLPVSLHELSDFSALGETSDALLRSEIILLYDDADSPLYYRQLNHSHWVLAIGPITREQNDRANWIVPVFYSLLALAIFVWMRPLGRDLEALRNSAAAFGEQDFSNRVDIPAGSWLQPLGSAFNSMARRIEGLIQSHRELTQAVSHELRTPLARMRFSLEMLGQNSTGQNGRHVTALDADITELNTLIEEMLSYAELDQANVSAQIEQFEITAFLQNYLTDNRFVDSPIPVQFDQSMPHSMVYADSRLLSRALDNLIGNAVRYAHSSVELSYVQDGENGHLHVIDDGPGIPADKRALVLIAYKRLEPGESQGFGLGLAIVSRIMQLHEGSVSIGSGEKGGADVCLIWPSRPRC